MPTYRHYVSADIYGDSIARNILIVKEDEVTGDLYFIKEEDLDIVDQRRIAQILRKRNANQYPLWELLAETTLKNGMNALEYFHQLVQVRTATGKIVKPSATRHGLRPTINRPVEEVTLRRDAAENKNPSPDHDNVQAPPKQTTQKRRGRPKKKV